MKKLFFGAALFAAAAFSSCSKHDNVEPPVPPETTPLAIAFAEGNSLQFGVDETKTVHYTITGGSNKTVVKAELQKSDDAYTVKTTPTSATEGTITITAKNPTDNCVLVTVSDGSQTATTVIVVSAKSSSQELAIAFAEGNSLEFDAGETKTVHYTITGGSDNTVVKAKMQKSNGAYTVATTPTSATKGMIAITAKTPETENCIIVTVSDSSQTITAEIVVSTNPIPEEFAITFAEGKSLELGVNETKTIHYTITGGSDKTVVKAEMQNPDDAYTVETTPTSTTEGTITITAKTPSTENCIVVTVSDGSQSVTAEIAVTVTLKTSFDGKTAVVETPGTLSQLLADYDKKQITELTFIGNLNDEDIKTLKNLPNLAILDMENAKLEALPAEAFYKNKSLTSIKLPKTLKTIGNYAFFGCSSLTSVTIPDSVATIGDDAFCSCTSLTSVTIPDSVATIGNYAFCSCTSLKSITIPDSVTSIGDWAFHSCRSLTSVTIGNSVTTIGEQAFCYCSSLTSITIPDSVTSIGIYAFAQCSRLTSVTIPDSVTSIGYSAFSGCSRLIAFYGKFASSDNRCLIINGTLNSFAPVGLTSYVIPDSVTTIGEQAFYECRSLTSVTIPDSVTEIKYEAFKYCTGLTSITIPDSVTEIGDFAFYDCSRLTSVTIGKSVTSIGTFAFTSCSRLKNIYCKAQTPPSVSVDYSPFDFNATLYIPTGRKAAYAADKGWKNFSKIIEMEF